MKKAAIAAALLAVAAIGLWAGGAPEGGAKPQAAAPATGVEPNVMPVVKQPMTLKMFAGVTSSSTTKTNAEHPGWKELEKRTGIRIDFQHPAAGDYNVQLNLMVASGDYADLISGTWVTIPGGVQKYLDDGVFVDLKDAVARYAPNLQKRLALHSEVRKSATTDKGQFFMFPFFQKPAPEQVIYGGLHLRKDWLDKVGLKVPVTMEEWHTVLTAFRNTDPNGNGKKDEIPLSNAWNKGTEDWTTFNVFRGAYGVTGAFMPRKDGKVAYGPIEPGYRMWLAEMRRWYAEGLIDPDYLTNDRKAIDANMLGNRIGAFSELSARTTERFLEIAPPKIPGFDLVAAPWPKGTDKTGYAIYPMWTRMDGHKGTAVSVKAKDKLREVVKWGDYWYSDEGILLTNFGIEGESYTLVGGKPVYADLVMKNPQRDTSQMMAHYRALDADTLGYETWESARQFYRKPQTLAALETWKSGDYSILMPVLMFGGDEGRKVATIMADVETLVSGARDKVIMGLEPMETWDRVVEQIRKMSIAEAIAINQAAYDRFLAK